MGYGSYKASDWTKLKTSRKLEEKMQVSEIYKRMEINPKFNPKYIGTRECFDSAEHPNTTPIVVGLDVTGSMGYLATEVATKSLNELITKLYSTGAVEDPALMCAAYGDANDKSPLQVTQFESDIRIAEQLLDIYFENRGQGQVAPTCLWEFLSRHTDIDAIKKRNKKGFLFTIGDTATIRSDDVGKTINRVIGDNAILVTRESLLKEVQKKFHVFHIMIKNHNEFTEWPNANIELLPGHIIVIARDQIESLAEIIISAIQLQNGKNLNEILGQWDPIDVPVISAAIKQLEVAPVGQALSL